MCFGQPCSSTSGKWDWNHPKTRKSNRASNLFRVCRNSPTWPEISLKNKNASAAKRSNNIFAACKTWKLLQTKSCLFTSAMCFRQRQTIKQSIFGRVLSDPTSHEKNQKHTRPRILQTSLSTSTAKLSFHTYLLTNIRESWVHIFDTNGTIKLAALEPYSSPLNIECDVKLM